MGTALHAMKQSSKLVQHPGRFWEGERLAAEMHVVQGGLAKDSFMLEDDSEPR